MEDITGVASKWCKMYVQSLVVGWMDNGTTTTGASVAIGRSRGDVTTHAIMNDVMLSIGESSDGAGCTHHYTTSSILNNLLECYVGELELPASQVYLAAILDPK